MRLMVCLLFLLGLAMVRAEDEFGEFNGNEQEENSEVDTENFEDPEPIQSDRETPKAKKNVEKDIVAAEETTALEENDQQHKKGFCQFGSVVWYKPGFTLRCNCMKCTCLKGGNWDCGYYFSYCPFYYCGGTVYNPGKQLCCCGKVYTKRATYSCCGYAYYNTRTAKCCNFYTVKPRNANCPRYQIGIPSGKKG